MIIPIFGPREESSVLAHDSSHCVPGITLPPGDANHLLVELLFHCYRGLACDVRKKYF